MERICVIKDIYKALYRFERDFADEHGITINEAMVLCALREGETRTAGALSEYVGLSNSRVSKVITAVENKGYVRREIAPHDKRQMVFSLTDEAGPRLRGRWPRGCPARRSSMHSGVRWSRPEALFFTRIFSNKKYVYCQINNKKRRPT